ncbi:MAG: hypothetical protein ACXAEN_24920 [Candidatus Thorarchaeota archaeon]|jgi:hypothetical protein
MNQAQLERRIRFAEMSRRQKIREAQRTGQGQLAICEKGKSPQGPALGDATRNLHMKYPSSQLFTQGVFYVDHYRDRLLLNRYEMKNGITNQGLNDVLGVQFDAVTQKTTWYMGLIDLSGFTALDATDVYDDINQAGNGWDEFSSYTDANNGDSTTTRPVWPPDAPSGQSITNSTTQGIFDITASGTVKGIFVVAGTTAQASLKGNHDVGTTPPNILWSTALFSGGDVAVVNGDQLKVTYTVNAAAS